MKYFGSTCFEDTAYFNFEQDLRIADVFENDFDVERIITSLGILRKKSIVPGKTLLILDEIQMCPRALTSLKYFAENLSGLHVVSAGSLLGVAMSQMGKNISFPVGKVVTLTLRPLNFEEFLLACGEELLVDEVKKNPVSDVVSLFSSRLEGLYREYLITGGMPNVVNTWLSSKNIEDVDAVLDSILSDYQRDFVKYAPKSEFAKLSAVFEGIPVQLARENQKFVFSRIKSGARARDLEDALFWLLGAGIIHKVMKIEQPVIPLASFADAGYFKIYLSDVGLLRRLGGFDAGIVFDSSSESAYIRGILAENFVLSELYAVLPSSSKVYFWRSGNTAEVDFVFQHKMDIIPLEVKAGKNTRAKSLGVYRKKYLPRVALRVSLEKGAVHDDEFGWVIELPLYLMWNLTRVI